MPYMNTWIKMKKVKRKLKAYLHPDVMLGYVLTDDKATTEMIERNTEYDLVCSSFGFWEMMVCLTPEEIKAGAEKIHLLYQKIISFDFAFMEGKEPLKPDENRIKHLRTQALKKNGNEKDSKNP